jgi:dGTPase
VDDIIKISVEKIYRSREVLEKEISGYKVIQTLLEVFTTAASNEVAGKATNYDKLLLSNFLSHIDLEERSTYEYLLEISCFVASMTDGNALRVYRNIQADTLFL